MTMKSSFVQAQKIILPAKNILLATHENPDSDAIGSLLAMKIGLEKIGKNALAFCKEKIPACLNFLPHAGEITYQIKPDNFDLAIGLDYGDTKRLAIGDYSLNKNNFLTIDHHLVGDYQGVIIVNSNRSSTAEIIFELFLFLNIGIDQEIATCLLTGIYSDTGGFRYSNTSAQTLKTAGELMLKGAPLSKIVRLAGASDLPENVGFWIQAFKNVQIDLETGVIFSVVTYENLDRLKQTFSNSDIANLFSNVPEAKFALLCAEKEPGLLECSLRSQPGRGVNVAAIAKLFGGGGHRLAAGFETTVKPEELVGTIKNLLWKNFTD
jgi:phosphoesterase RecJ-like protein